MKKNIKLSIVSGQLIAELDDDSNETGITPDSGNYATPADKTTAINVAKNDKNDFMSYTDPEAFFRDYVQDNDCIARIDEDTWQRLQHHKGSLMSVAKAIYNNENVPEWEAVEMAVLSVISWHVPEEEILLLDIREKLIGEIKETFLQSSSQDIVAAINAGEIGLITGGIAMQIRKSLKLEPMRRAAASRLGRIDMDAKFCEEYGKAVSKKLELFTYIYPPAVTAFVTFAFRTDGAVEVVMTVTLPVDRPVTVQPEAAAALVHKLQVAHDNVNNPSKA